MSAALGSAEVSALLCAKRDWRDGVHKLANSKLRNTQNAAGAKGFRALELRNWIRLTYIC
jgi:hypothetical protein